MQQLKPAQGSSSTRLQRVQAEGARGESEFQLMVRQGESSEAQP